MPPLPPQPDPGGLGRGLRRRLDRLGARYDSWAERNPEGVARLRLWTTDLSQVPPREGLLGLLRSFMHSVAPPNWEGLRPGASIVGVGQLINATGLCLVWVPDADVISELLAADGKPERDALLIRNREPILASIDRVLAEVTRPELALLRDLAGQALAAARDGHFAATQTLSATILAAALEDHYGFTFGRAREAFAAEPPASAGLWTLRRALVQRALQLAFLKSRDRSPDAGFNRHLSAGHGRDLAHLTQPHAIEALLLVGGTLRELQGAYRLAECGFGPTERLARYAASHASPLPATPPIP